MGSSGNKLFWVLLVVGVIAVSAIAWIIGGKLYDVKNARGRQQGEQTVKTNGTEKDRAGALTKARPDDTGDRAAGIGQADTYKPDDDDLAKDSEDKPKDGDEADKAKKDNDDKAAKTDDDEDRKVEDKAVKKDDGKDDKTKPDEDKKPAPDKKPVPDKGSDKPAGKLYHVQLGRFDSIENARKLADEACAKTGLPVQVVPETVNGETKYRVQGGAYSTREAADKTARELEMGGYKVFVK